MSWKNYYTGDDMSEKDIIDSHFLFLRTSGKVGKQQVYKIMVKDGYFKTCVIDWQEEGWKDLNIKLPKN